MRLPRSAAGALVLLALLGGGPLRATAQVEPTVLYLVRHAERLDASDDTPLSESGRQRAEALAHLLRDAGITRVLSTDYARTRQTAAPLAGAAGVEIELYDPRQLAAFAGSLAQRPGAALVVGHSNTTPELVAHLGGTPGASIAHDEYDRLYVVVLQPGRAPVTSLLRYGGP